MLVYRFLAPVTLTLIYELDIGILKMYLHTKNEVSKSRLLKVRARHDKQTDTLRHRHTDKCLTTATCAGGEKAAEAAIGKGLQCIYVCTLFPLIEAVSQIQAGSLTEAGVWHYCCCNTSWRLLVDEIQYVNKFIMRSPYGLSTNEVHSLDQENQVSFVCVSLESQSEGGKVFHSLGALAAKAGNKNRFGMVN